jgi:hypothetical protein
MNERVHRRARESRRETIRYKSARRKADKNKNSAFSANSAVKKGFA